MGDRPLMLTAARLQFLRFAAAGVAGFFVDAAALNVAIHQFGAGLYAGRLLSYLIAASFTWALNRRFTFATRRDHRVLREWFKFLAANAAGGLINYGVYAALVGTFDFVATWPVIGVAAGSAAGLIANFTLSKRLVFNSF
jgi:putative flippase GtrA